MRSTITGILALLAIALLAGPATAGSDTVAITPVAKAALAIPGADTKGHRLTAVHYWAIWCAPCQEELPALDTVATAEKENGFRVVTISLDTDMAKVEKFFADKNIRTLTPAIDKNNAAFVAAKLGGLPGTLFFNKDGELIARADGPVDWSAKATQEFIALPH